MMDLFIKGFSRKMSSVEEENSNYQMVRYTKGILRMDRFMMTMQKY